MAGFMHAECREGARGVLRGLVRGLEDEEGVVGFFEEEE